MAEKASHFILGFDLNCSLTLMYRLYMISVRKVRVLPAREPFSSQDPTFYRSHLTMGTHAFG